MGMIGAGIDLKFFKHLAAQLVFGEHPLDRLTNNIFRLAGQKFLCRNFSDPAGKTGVAIVLFISHFVTGQANFFSIQDNDKIPGINTWGIDRLMFPAQDTGDSGRNAPQNLSVEIDDKPVPIDL